MSSHQSNPASVFISYSHKDEGLLNELIVHLSALRRQGVVATWHDRRITPGSEWAGEIDSHLEEADVILLLISADFIHSDYCHDIEMKRALERHDAGEALVIPIFLRFCDWKGEPFGKIQALPTDAKPVEGPAWHDRDEAFTVIAQGIRRAIENLRQRRQAGKSGTELTPLVSPSESNPTPVTDAAPAPFQKPKLRNTSFNAYQAGRDILAFLEAELSTRMSEMENAGYVVDHHQRDGKTCFRIEADARTVYFLDMWQGGSLGSDKALSFFHGWGNYNARGNSMTATATPVPDENTGEAKLDVINFSLLGHGTVQKNYTQKEFLQALWHEIVSTVDQVGRQ